MNYKNVSLTSRGGTPFALSNEFPETTELTDAIEDAKDEYDLVNRLKKINSYIKTFTVERVTENYIRIKCIAYMCNNEYLLIIYKK